MGDYLERRFWNVYAKSYDNLARHFQPYKDLVQEVCDHVDEYAQGRSLRILDAGCGTGNYSLELVRRGHSVVGLDMSDAMLARARSKAKGLHGVDFLRHDLSQPLPFDDGEFDAATCVHVLYAVPFPAALVCQLRRLVASGGLVTVVNPRYSARPLASLEECRRNHGFRSAAVVSASLASVAVWNLLINRRQLDGHYKFTGEQELRAVLQSSDLLVRKIATTYTLNGSVLAVGQVADA